MSAFLLDHRLTDPSERASQAEPGNTRGRGRAVLRCLGVWLFLLAVAWLAHFSFGRSIGFFSDDQTFAVRPLLWSPAEFRFWLRYKTLSYPEPQGRPLGFMLGILLAHLGDLLAGVNGMFIIGWWILSLNAILFYHLLKRCFDGPLPVLGSIGFLLFPADTTRPFLCHQHILQTSLTFMLVASHLYLGGGKARRGGAYFLVTLCLITYESALLPFLAIPLLERPRDSAWKKRFAIHVGTVLLIVAVIGLTRKLGHEYRTEEANGSKFTVLVKIAAGSLIGLGTAVFSYGLRAYTAVMHLCRSPGCVVGFLSAFGVFWLMLRLSRCRLQTDVSQLRGAVDFGAAALGVSYLLSFTHFPPGCLEGQTTSVHLAAVVGASTLFAAACTALLQRGRWKLTVTAGIALYLALLFTSAVAEQEGYVTLWRERQQFWTRLMDLCPDLEDHTLIVCDGQLPQPNHLMPANCWSDSVVLEQAYLLPSTFIQNPQVSCFPTGTWQSWLARDSNGRVVWTKSPYGRAVGDQLVEGNTIVLEMDAEGGLRRVNDSIVVAGKPFSPRKFAGRKQLPFPISRFYNILTGAGD